MSTESFEARVQELVREGKLTSEEAAQLLGKPETPGAPRPEPAPDVAPDAAPPRLRIEITNGDVLVRGRPGLVAPRLVNVSAGVTMRATAAGWCVEHRPVPDLASALDWVRAGLSTIAHGVIEIEVPESMEALDIRVLSGTVEVDEVRARVSVTLTAGEVDLDGVTGFDITARTGSVRVRGKIDQGHHRIQAYTGDAELVFEPGSSATLAMQTLFGRLDARRVSVTSAGLVARSHDAKIGDGAAHVRVETVAGDIDVRTAWEA